MRWCSYDRCGYAQVQLALVVAVSEIQSESGDGPDHGQGPVVGIEGRQQHGAVRDAEETDQRRGRYAERAWNLRTGHTQNPYAGADCGETDQGADRGQIAEYVERKHRREQGDADTGD